MRECVEDKCMRQTRTIQVLYYISTNSLTLTFGNFLKLA